MYSDTRKLFRFLFGGLLLWAVIRYFLPIMSPFALGAGLALAAEPGVHFLCRRLHLPRGAAAGLGVGFLFCIICVLITVLFTFVFRELGVLAGILPDMEITVRDGLDALRDWLLTLSEKTPETVQTVLRRNVTELFSSGSALLDKAVRYGLGLAGTILGHVPDSALGLGTAVLSAFLTSAKLPQIRQWVRDHLSRERLEQLLDTGRKIKSTVLLWLTAQLKLVGITYSAVTAGFLLLRISYAPLWALAVAAVDAFPILGTGTILVPWSIVCFLQHNSPRGIGLLGLYAAVSLTRSILEPKLVGQQLGLDSLVTLAALYVGFRLWGLTGMLVMPMLAVTAMRLAEEGV